MSARSPRSAMRQATWFSPTCLGCGPAASAPASKSAMSWAWPGSHARNAPRMRPSAWRAMSCTCRPRMSVYQASERSASRTKMLTWSRAIGLWAIGIPLLGGGTLGGFPPSPPLRVDHRRGAADDEGVVALEEVGDDLGERFGTIAADGAAGVVDEHQVRAGDALRARAPGGRRAAVVARAEQDEGGHGRGAVARRLGTLEGQRQH